MGVNAAGFAIMNAESRDLEGDQYDGEGFLMKQALASCRSVADFERLLLQTNSPGRATTANFGVIDTTGNGAIFETGNHTYTRFDAATTPLGYLVRANYALTGINPEAYGYQRRARADVLFRTAAEQHKLSHQYILQQVARDLVNDRVNPYPLPFTGRQDTLPPGAVYTNNSINRFRTCSVAVFHGIRAGEDPRLTTMWVILGEPVCGIALPLWPVGVTLPAAITTGNPVELNLLVQQLESQIYSIPAHPRWLVTSRLQNRDGHGLLPDLLVLENNVLAAGAQTRRELAMGIQEAAVISAQNQIVEMIISQLKRGLFLLNAEAAAETKLNQQEE